MHESWTIRRGLPLLAVGVLAAVVATLTAASYVEVRDQARAAAEERLERLAGELMRRSSVAARLPRLSRAAGSPAVAALVEGGGAEAAAAVRAELEAVRSEVSTSQVTIGVWDRTGAPLVAVNGDSVPGWGSVAPVRAESGTISPIQATDDTTVFYDLVVPVEAGGATVAWLAERRRLVSAPQQSQTLEALIGPGGGVLFGNPSGDLWVKERGVVAARAGGIEAAPGAASYVRDSTEYIGFSQPIPNMPWLVMVEMTSDHALAPARAYLRRIIAVAGGLLLLGALAAVVLSRRLTAPLAGVVDAARGVAAGDYTQRVRIRGPAELADVASSFNRMADRVEHRTRELAESEARFRSLVTASSQVVWTADPEGRVRGPIPSWQAFTDQDEEEVRGTGWASAIHPEDLERTLGAWTEAVRRGSPFEAECRLQRSDGVYRLLALRAVPVVRADGSTREWVGTGSDITERRDAERLLLAKEDELRQAHKMEAVGRLAGGVAHDFNNLLTAILGPVAMAQDQLPADHPARAELEDIRTAAQRAADLTRQLLALSRQSTLSETVVDLGRIAEETGRLLHRVIGESIQLRVTPSPDRCSVRADRAHLEQIILNLAVNARDAMPEGGVLAIETRIVELDAEYAEQHPTVRPGRYVLLSVADTGVGMSPDTIQHLFEPFFTTKEAGKGTGLGLATVHGIVRQCEGHVLVFSQPGRGSTFQVYLPHTSVGDRQPVPQRGAPSARGGTETILLVEDDDAVRGVAVRSLSRLGYRVLPAADGHAALAILARAGHEIRIVVTDVVMPGMSGGELARHIERERPGMPVLFLSGYADEAVAGRGVIREGSRFLRKPFTPDSLGARVRAILDETEASRPVRAASSSGPA
ncbi:MAG TPA: ATP-binding protein [Longimicrobiales bacterium]|nr:ATP-binding protein [Longimicrobiales bacterium]